MIIVESPAASWRDIYRNTSTFAPIVHHERDKNVLGFIPQYVLNIITILLRKILLWLRILDMATRNLNPSLKRLSTENVTNVEERLDDHWSLGIHSDCGKCLCLL